MLDKGWKNIWLKARNRNEAYETANEILQNDFHYSISFIAWFWGFISKVYDVMRWNFVCGIDTFYDKTFEIQ